MNALFHETEFLNYIYIHAVMLLLQIHYMEDGTLEIFSKSSERYTGKYPDVVLALSR